MPKFPALLLSALLLSTPTHALKISVWDSELQTKLGDGESSGGQLRVRLVGDYSGPVVVLFAPSDEERTRNTFPALKSRYSGVLRGGMLDLQLENGPQTITRFLTAFKLTVSLQVPGTPMTLPGLKAAPANKK
ncbi:hypothetical protein [Deinococcus aquaticus]|uniref:CHRD domain-containing protein n=1 Tax=Deinococcus aquaticus TaxID=328692 RepID=A0ABY7V4Q6_9DEIO|nr:hypothetical protein [Deinococcus aquaticus]WDA59574.1 hypothetical protein M8445_05000 [Deinococcus aquaticus]